MRKKTKSQFVSLITAGLLVFNQTGFAPGLCAFPASEVNFPSPGFTLSIPPKLGTIEKSISGRGSLIVHIQTAHGNYEAQKKIQAILHYLKDKYGIKLLLLEGTAFKLHPELLKLFPKRMDLTMKALDELAKRALVKGPELFLAEAPDAEAYGIEDIDAYVRNGKDFRAVLSKQQETEAFLGKIHLQLERLMGTYLSKELRSFLKRQEDYETKRIPLPEWISYLEKQAQAHLNLDLSDPAWQIDWPMFYRIIKLKEIEEKLDGNAYAREREEFLKQIQSSLVGAQFIAPSHSKGVMNHAPTIFEQIQSLLSSPLSHHQLPDPEIGLLFEEMVSSLPLDFNYNTYPNVKLFIAHLILQSELKGDLLFEEMEALTHKLSQKLAKVRGNRRS